MSNRLPVDVAEKLLDRLEQDDAFRDRFSHDPRAALSELGYQVPRGDLGMEGKDPILPLQHLKGGLASKEKIKASRQRLLGGLRDTDSSSALAFSQFDICAD